MTVGVPLEILWVMLISFLRKEIRNFVKLSSDMKVEKEFPEGILTLLILN